MDAKTATEHLGGKWLGSYGLARCPAHDDNTPSLSLTDGESGLLWKCHAGCTQEAVQEALKAVDIIGGDRDAGPRPAQSGPSKAERSAQAVDLWRRGKPVPGTVSAIYLRSRGVEMHPPQSLRHLNDIAPHIGYEPIPCLVAAVQAPDRTITAIQKTRLTAHGRKAPLKAPRITLGPLDRGAVRLGHAAEVMGIAEGVEDALSAMELTGIVTWAALGAKRLSQVWLPDICRKVVIFADNDDTGRECAYLARGMQFALGRDCEIRTAPDGGDWNDELCRQRRVGMAS